MVSQFSRRPSILFLFPIKIDYKRIRDIEKLFVHSDPVLKVDHVSDFVLDLLKNEKTIFCLVVMMNLVSTGMGKNLYLCI